MSRVWATDIAEALKVFSTDDEQFRKVGEIASKNAPEAAERYCVANEYTLHGLHASAQ